MLLLLLVVCPLGYGWFLFVQLFLEIPVMLCIGFGFKHYRYFGKLLLTGWCILIFLNGIAEGLLTITGGRGMSLLTFFVMYLLTACLLRLFQKNRRVQTILCAVTIRQKDKEIHCVGLLDTGNLLTLPGTGIPVHIVSKGLFEEQKKEEMELPAMEIPYSSLGEQEGKIQVVMVNSMEFEVDKEKRVLHNVWLGLAEERLFERKSYQMIVAVK